jgi:hypothetical protein
MLRRLLELIALRKRRELAKQIEPGYAYSEEFDFGLVLILDGLERVQLQL